MTSGDAPASGNGPMRPRLLIAATGSVSTVSLPHYLVVLKRHCPEIDLRILLTRSARQFVRPRVLRLFCPITTESPKARWSMQDNHIALATWADAMIVLPASADVLARAAHGLGDTLLVLAILAHERPVTFFPNMNHAMWHNPATQRNVEILGRLGHTVVEPVAQRSYEVFAGEEVEGSTLPGPAAVAETVAAILKSRTAD